MGRPGAGSVSSAGYLPELGVTPSSEGPNHVAGAHVVVATALVGEFN
jgi:hypothetical protein